MTILKQALQDYLAIRRALGFKLEQVGYYLPNFVSFVEKSGSEFITIKLSLAWAQGEKNPPPRTWPKRLSMVRKFSEYQHARDSRTEIPLPGHAPRFRKRIEPFIYKDTDIQALILAASKHPPKLKGATYSTMIGLLASTGMRVGEAIALDRSDFNSKGRLILIRQTKFGKTRQIPLHQSTVDALCRYAKERDRLMPRASTEAFFISNKGRRVLYDTFQSCFRRLANATGLQNKKSSSPRIHDLRHSFAINTLVGWYRAGLDVGPKLPALSTYLGHVSPSCTYWYLSATPELLDQARLRLEKIPGGQS